MGAARDVPFDAFNVKLPFTKTATLRARCILSPSFLPIDVTVLFNNNPAAHFHGHHRRAPAPPPVPEGYPLHSSFPRATMADASAKYHASSDFLPHTSAVTTAELDDVAAHDGLVFWQFMVAGSIAGLVEHTAMFPVDTLKTRMQALPSCRPSAPAALRQAFLTVLRQEGPQGFYRGISAMGLGAGPAHAVYFSVYELSKSFLSLHSPSASLAHAASGVLATVASDAVFTPMDTVKQRLQLTGSPYHGVADCVGRVVREEGPRALYASYRTTVLMNAPYTAVHFAAYEAAKKGLAEMGTLEEESGGVEGDEGLVIHATAGAAAGALAAAVTTPLDVVKTQLQCQGVCGCDRFSNSSIAEVIRTIVKREGYAGLIRGWKPRMLFHAPAAAICWSTYESCKSFFQRP